MASFPKQLSGTNAAKFLQPLSKAKLTILVICWLGKKPKVRGVVKNPIDHPHGGGEGRSPIGRPKPVTPWGKPALGIKTRKQTKASGKYILRSRR